ncbi:hypothetical protein EXIGLDRAFT_780290 [Exidia glandulosa HHB12029]|uniref:Uncharacterized protein n=1 Tax=Exidia glandulosa HHB12029 TaxID=1314781 RepID=A0A165BP39_EXIGL|nr:hypothetical protein EXIGLDRAFT_780290 [Exidia glandulosa HHB12029]
MPSSDPPPDASSPLETTRPVYGPPRPPTMLSTDEDNSSSAGSPTGLVLWTMDNTPPRSQPEPQIVGTPWLNGSHVTAAIAHQTDTPSGPVSRDDNEQGDLPTSPERLESCRASFTLPPDAGIIMESDLSDDEWDADAESDWERWRHVYLVFAQATRTCASRRAQHGLPTAFCSRIAPCALCGGLPGSGVPSPYWHMLDDTEVDRMLHGDGTSLSRLFLVH